MTRMMSKDIDFGQITDNPNRYTDLFSKRYTQLTGHLNMYTNPLGDEDIIKEYIHKKETISKIKNLKDIIGKYYFKKEEKPSQYMNKLEREILRLEENEEIRRGFENRNQLISSFIDHHSLYEAKKLFKEKGYSPEFFVDQVRTLLGSFNPLVVGSLEAFNKGNLNKRFGVEYLSQFVKEGQTLTEDELRKYGLRQDMRTRASHYGNEFKQKYFDTMYNFCLTYNGQLVASLGFDVEQGAIFVRQIQGIKGNSDKLKPIKWERALLTHAIQWAEANGIPEVRVISVENNSWAKHHGHLDPVQGKMLYDVTARRVRYNGLAFERDENSKDYFMKLPQRFQLAAA